MNNTHFSQLICYSECMWWSKMMQSVNWDSSRLQKIVEFHFSCKNKLHRSLAQSRNDWALRWTTSIFLNYYAIQSVCDGLKWCRVLIWIVLGYKRLRNSIFLEKNKPHRSHALSRYDRALWWTISIFLNYDPNQRACNGLKCCRVLIWIISSHKWW